MRALIRDAESLREYVIRRLQKKAYNMPTLVIQLRELTNIVNYYYNHTKEGVEVEID